MIRKILIVIQVQIILDLPVKELDQVLFFFSKRNFNKTNTLLVSPSTDTRARQVSLASLPASKDEKVTENRRRAVSELPKPKLDDLNTPANDSVSKSVPAEPATESTGQDKSTEKTQVNENSECVCTDHYPTTVMEQVYGGSVEGMYNLLFNNDFMKKFLVENQKLTGIIYLQNHI